MKMLRQSTLIFMLICLSALPVAADNLLVFAASSLREAFLEIGQLYEEQTGKKVSFNFAGSQTLRTQIEFGAPADLYAAANPETITPLVNKGLVGDIHFFASNNLTLLLSRRHSKVQKIADLARSDVQIAIGSAAVPIGKYSRQLLAAMGNDTNYGQKMIDAIWNNVRTEESSVKAIVSKLLLDEVDAGIVYRTDLIAEVSAKTTNLELPPQYNPRVRYPLAIVKESQQPESAQTFLALVLAPAGQKILQQKGFQSAQTGENP